MWKRWRKKEEKVVEEVVLIGIVGLRKIQGRVIGDVEALVNG
jgi:hypothetical protein